MVRQDRGRGLFGAGCGTEGVVKMDGAEIRKVSEEALEQLATSLEQGQSETLKRYLAVMGRFTHYSLGNQILIAQQKPEATHVAGYRAWQRLGRRVRRGERAIWILAPIVRRPKEEDDEETLLAFRSACVFDISQTDGESLDTFKAVEGDPGDWIARLQTYVASLGIELKYEQALGGAIGVSQGGTILLKADLASSEQFSALVHELAHEMLHQGKEDRPASKVVRELDAEAVAFVVSQAIGLDAMDSSRDYIHLYNVDKQTLLRSLERIRRTAVTILNGITPPPLDESGGGGVGRPVCFGPEGRTNGSRMGNETMIHGKHGRDRLGAEHEMGLPNRIHLCLSVLAK